MAAALTSVACGASDPERQEPFTPGAGGMFVPGATGGTNPGGGGVMGGGGVVTGGGGVVTGAGGVVTGAGGAITGPGGMVGTGGILPGSGGSVVGGGGMPGSGGATVEPGCNLHTKYLGDENCILPPPEDKGFQVHYGPKDYDDPVEVAKYLVPPGQDTTVQGNVTAGNKTDVYFYKRQYRMRPGSHHLIVYDSAGGSGGVIGTGRRLGGTQNQVKDNPTGPMPPENEGIGMPLKANAQLRLDIHHYNGTDEPILREAWINFWYVPTASVKQEAKEMFLMASGPTIAPNQRVVVKGERSVPTDGRILTTYGHRHSNNVRFSAWRTRGADKKQIYEDYDWKEPKVLEYNTLTTNPAPNATALTGGGYSGILDLKAGDKISWECEIVNKSGGTIIFNQNEAVTSEMCILIGDTIGVTISPF